MKKALSLLTVSALSIGMLSACGPKDSGKKEESKAKKDYDLLVWEDEKKGVGLEPAVKSFEKKYNVKVKVEEVQMTKQIEKLRLDGPAGTGPDVVTLPHDHIGNAVTEGLLSEVKVDDTVKSKFTDLSIEAQTYNGKIYGLPKAIETPIFIYNKKMMQKAPETMDELFNFSKDFTKNGKYGFLALGDNFYFANAFMAGMGGYVFGEKDGKPNANDIGLNNSGAVQGAEYIQKWYKEKLFPKGIIGESGGSAADGLFNEGKAASIMNGPWAFQAMEKAGIDYGVAPMPKLPNGQPMKTFVGVKGWHVTSFSKQNDLATKFTEWVTNEENAKIRFEKTKEIPPVKSVMEDPIIKENEAAKAVATQSENGIPMPNIPEMQEVWKPAGDALQLVVSDKEAPKSALDSAVKQIKGNIEANHSKKK
ncbi:extracellular solute-binding protein [Bacillus cereus]|uniref:extracellular solute-binding protein n=1 Tax=Bacillus cereus TaxID=1396 RepID=UPI0007AC1B74|nr:extracellular solute-binding protein [Bacillus cereus]KZD31665.1 Maltose/maltodextrin ABC transporter substrate binding periplasmic protein MalE [Bacillus cereus]MCC2395060.1 extracellular solute-binding protein [Bacillus cereus]MCU5659267.1 extracellular solute-binding protein [Bacillus cereus]MCU5721593.1 extracellular solute-binding protein [Bacillus cereus]OJD86816.1 cyclodextrin-binding protein [Bacillus cereus]